MRVTERDVAILKEIYNAHFLDADQASRVIQGSKTNIKRRLRFFFRAGFLERHVLSGHQPKQPLIYSLTKRGVKLLERESGFIHGLKWSKVKSKPNVEHALLTSEAIISFMESAKKQGLPFQRLNLEASESRGPAIFEVCLQGQSFGLAPDASFSVGQNNFFLEADRGTMPILRKDLKGSSFFKKLLLYHELAKSKGYTKLGLDNFRVLTVTTSEERIASMLKALDKLPGFSKLFYFSTERAVKNCDPREIRWYVRGGNKIFLN